MTALFPFIASAFESLPFKSPEECGAWRSQVTTWLQTSKVKLVGDEMEVKVVCGPQTNIGYIFWRLSDERAQRLSQLSVSFDCAPSGAKPAQRTVASVESRLDTPCKHAANDIKLFQQEITGPPVVKTGGLDWYCCNGAENNRVVGSFACGLIGCLSCPRCLSHSSTGAWHQ